MVAVLPVWMATYPPLGDLPQHAAQVRMLIDLLNGDPGYVEIFRINWFTPNLFGYLLLALFTQVFGILVACKLVVSLALGAMPLVVAVLLRELRGNPAWCWLALPGCYGFSYHYGFVNFILGAPLGLLFLATAIHYARQPKLSTGVWQALLLHLLFFCHASLLIFFGVIAGLLVLLQARAWGARLKALLPYFAVLPVCLAWGLQTLGAEQQTHWQVLWMVGWSRLPQLVECILGASATPTHVFLVAALLAAPWLLGGRPSRDPARYVPLVIGLCAFFFLPNFAVGAFYLYQRSAIFLIPFYLLAFEPGPAAARTRLLAQALIIVLGAGWAGYNMYRAASFEVESADFREALAVLPPGQRVLSMVHFRYSRYSPLPAYLHLPLWYQALEGGLVDFNFAVNYNQLVRYRPEHLPPVGHDFVWEPTLFDWQTYRGLDYDYFMVRNVPGNDTPPFPPAECRLVLLKHSQTWWVYRVVHTPEARAGCMTEKHRE